MRSPAVEMTVTKWPDFWRRNTGRAAAMPYRTPRRFTSIIASQSSTARSSSGPLGAMPALATITSSRPKRFIARATSSARSSRRRTSVTRCATSYPSAAIAPATFSSRSLPRAPSTRLGSISGQQARCRGPDPTARAGDGDNLALDALHALDPLTELRNLDAAPRAAFD